MSGQKEKDGILYGCHVDLSPGEEPDGCVIDYGAHGDCVFAVHESGRKRKSMWTCKYWRPVKSIAADTSAGGGNFSGPPERER